MKFASSRWTGDPILDQASGSGLVTRADTGRAIRSSSTPTNFTDLNDLNQRIRRGSGATLHVIERFTRVDTDKIDYQFTVDDPTTFTKPWTATLPMAKIQGPIYEYACHEGNYGMSGILSGHRAQEKAAAGAKKTGSN